MAANEYDEIAERKIKSNDIRSKNLKFILTSISRETQNMITDQ